MKTEDSLDRVQRTIMANPDWNSSHVRHNLGAARLAWLSEVRIVCEHCGTTDPNHGRCIFEDL